MDAQMLARLVRVDPRLLRPIQHRSEQAQEHLRVIRVRAALVEARTMLVNAARGLTKATGERLPSCDADQMGEERMESLPAGLQNSLRPLLEEVESLTEKIQALDQQVEQIARTDYPETGLLRQVSGVGPLIALTFVLTVEDRERFQKSRDVGCYVGLRPRQSDSGESEPHHQGRGSLSAEAAGAGGALHYGAARTGYGSKALGVEVKRTRWQERQEAGRGGSGSEAGDSAASAVGNWGSVRTVAEQPG
jgi:transposase